MVFTAQLQALLYARYFLPQVIRGAAMGCPSQKAGWVMFWKN
jgi:hypothetical protein